MHWKTIALLVSALLLASMNLVADAGGKDAAKDKKKLQGAWVGKKDNEKIMLTFDADKFKFEFKGEAASGTFTVDPDKTPKEMNLAVEKGTGDNTKQYEGKTAKAIYEFDGKKLKWFASEPGRDQRPGAFPKEGEDSKGMYVVFEREKK